MNFSLKHMVVAGLVVAGLAAVAIYFSLGSGTPPETQTKAPDATATETVQTEEKATQVPDDDTALVDEKSLTDPEETKRLNESYAMGDIVLGDENAPLTVIEYASFTCPHCAAFHIQTWPQVKAQYIDTGKVKFIMREVYFDQFGLWVSMVSRCGGEAGFYPMVDTYLKTQSEWARGSDQEIGAAIAQIGRRAGLSNDQVAACLSDRAFGKALLEDYQRNAGADEVRSTPTFIIGGETHTGAMGFEDFSALLDAALSDS